MPYVPYNVFFGDDAYCYYAVVTKNCDKDKKEHINEIEIQAIPFTTDYTEKGPGIGSDAGKMWVPCVSSIVGVHSYKKDENNELPGYGVHSLPEVGSVVVVLAMRSNRSSNYSHVVLGNFWNRDVMVPKLSPIFYKPGGEEGKEEYNLDDLTKNENFADKIANTTYYKTKANTNVIADDFKGIYGIYRAPQEKDVDSGKFNGEDKQGRYYMMLDPKNSNIDVRVNNFTLTANQVTLYAKKKFSITTAEGKTLLQAKKKGTFNSKEDGISFTGKGGLNFKADAINMNKEDPAKPPEIDLNSLKLNMPETKIFDHEIIDSHSHLHCLVTTMVEINILRNDMDYINKYVNGNANSLISITKDVKLYAGMKADGTNLISDQEFDLSLTDEEVERALYPIKEAGSKFVVDTAELLTEPTDVEIDYKTRPTDEQLRDVGDKNVKVKFDVDLWNYHAKHIIIKRKVVFKYDPDRVGPSIDLIIHSFIIGGAAPFLRYTDKAQKDGIAGITDEADKRFKPNYNNKSASIKIPAGTRWDEVLKNNEDVKKYLNGSVLNASAPYPPYYVDMDATLASDKESVKITGAGDFHKGEAGIIKFEVFPYSTSNQEVPARGPEDMSFTRNNPNEAGHDNMYGACFANFNFAVNNHADDAPANEKDKNRLKDDGIVKMKGSDLIGDASAADKQDEVHVYVRYSVVRYLPLIMMCRGLTDIDADNGHDKAYLKRETREYIIDKKFPILTHDIYDKQSRFAVNAGAGNANSPYFNKVWKMMPCTSDAGRYKKMLIKEQSNEKEAFLYLKDTDENFKNRTNFVTWVPSVYRENAESDMIKEWNGNVNNFNFKIGEEFSRDEMVVKQPNGSGKEGKKERKDNKGTIPPPPPPVPRIVDWQKDDDVFENICFPGGDDVGEYNRDNA
ncbi:MAG TPA: hypothetical protein DCO86_04400 [Spirochaetaceae bacterium]|nr:hypothetical protein [Spirochaetaceae bacterium]